VKKLEEYVSAGYYITKFVGRPAYVSKELMPDKMISLSTCIGKYFPNDWAIEWVKGDEKNKLKSAEDFGISAEKFKEVSKSITNLFDEKDKFGWPNVCFTLKIAKELVRQYIPDQSDVVIIGVGLHKSYVDEFCETAKPPPQQEGYAPVGPNGMYAIIKQKKHLEKGGEILGFEPLAYYYLLSCSWLCNRLEEGVKKKFNISPNRHGFIEFFSDAQRIVEYISSDEVKAEPGLWLPWLIVKYN